MDDQRQLWTRFYQIVGGELRLKSLQQIIAYLLHFIEGPNTSSKDVARLVSADPAISLKVLTVVNSPAMGLRYQVNDLAYAITLLGRDQIRDVILSVAIVETTGKRQETQLIRLWKHSFYCARIAEILALNIGKMSGEAFTIGLLHDIGKIVLAYSNPVAFGTTIQNFKFYKGRIQHWESEKQILGMTHAEIGGLAALQWKLPEVIYRSIWTHHSPIKGPLKTTEEFLSQLVYVADALCWSLKFPSVEGANPFALKRSERCVPEDFLLPLGLDNKKMVDIVPAVKEALLKSETVFEWIKILTGEGKKK